MSPELASIALVVGLFLLGVVSPGPNFLIVVERSLAGGFRAGFVTGCGVTCGDALYAAAGLVGLASVVTEVGWLLSIVKGIGGIYLAWIGIRMLRRSSSTVAGRHEASSAAETLGRCFRIGLLTDLSNPKTVVFFASIFAVSYDPTAPSWVAVAMWAGIVASSLTWRMGLSAAFSRPTVRTMYGRWRRGAEVAFGSALVVFGLRLAVPTPP